MASGLATSRLTGAPESSPRVHFAGLHAVERVAATCVGPDEGEGDLTLGPLLQPER